MELNLDQDKATKIEKTAITAAHRERAKAQLNDIKKRLKIKIGALLQLCISG